MSSSQRGLVRRREDDHDGQEAGAQSSRRARTSGSTVDRVLSAKSWQELFEVDATTGDEQQQHTRARAVRNRLVRIVHPDNSPPDPQSQQQAHAATAHVNQLWDQARRFFAPEQQTGGSEAAAATSTPLLSCSIPAHGAAAVEPGGSLEMLATATCMQPPVMLQRPELDAYIGYGNLTTLRGCRFLPMATNRCISQDVVAQRVSENLARLRERGAYYDFGQIAVVAVRSPPEEQYVEEEDGGGGGGGGGEPSAAAAAAAAAGARGVGAAGAAGAGLLLGCSAMVALGTASGAGASADVRPQRGEKRRLARFYVLDGQHRLSTMGASRPSPMAPMALPPMAPMAYLASSALPC
jgi:hypothetical protein